MGILDRSSKQVKSDDNVQLTQQELEFILTKMRLATYQGVEFEMFYNVWVKLVNRIEALK